MMFNVEVTGAARLYRAASVLTAGLDSFIDKSECYANISSHYRALGLVMLDRNADNWSLVRVVDPIFVI